MKVGYLILKINSSLMEENIWIDASIYYFTIFDCKNVKIILMVKAKIFC